MNLSTCYDLELSGAGGGSHFQQVSCLTVTCQSPFFFFFYNALSQCYITLNARELVINPLCAEA